MTKIFMGLVLYKTNEISPYRAALYQIFKEEMAVPLKINIEPFDFQNKNPIFAPLLATEFSSKRNYKNKNVTLLWDSRITTGKNTEYKPKLIQIKKIGLV
ncbi:MAG: hypothetical protein R3359_00550 [Marinirhabdus sp.]|nr:hypothetical protein [Marinirhabdus sp.]